MERINRETVPKYNKAFPSRGRIVLQTFLYSVKSDDEESSMSSLNKVLTLPLKLIGEIGSWMIMESVIALRCLQIYPLAKHLLCLEKVL